MIRIILALLIACTFFVKETHAIIISFPYVTQENYRWRNDDGTETTATWKGGVNTIYTFTTPDLDNNIRLRLEFSNTGDDIGNINNLLQYSTDGITWTNITTAPGTNHWVLSTSTLVAHEVMTTSQIGSGLTGTYSSGKIISNTTGGAVSLDWGYRTENEYVLRATNNVQSGTTYYFRVNLADYYEEYALLYTSCLAKVLSVVHGETCTPGSTVTLSATALAGNTLTWYDSDDLVVGTGPTFTTPPLTASTTYYVEASGTGGCTSTKVPVNASVSTYDYTTIEGYVCGSGSVELSIDYEVPGATVNWYADDAATVLLGTGDIFNTPSISTTTNYYAIISTPGCASEIIPLTATVRPLPALTVTPSRDTICPGDVATFNATIDPMYTYSWSTGDNTSSMTTSEYGTHSVTVTHAVTGCESTESVFLDTLMVARIDGFDFIPLYHTDYKTVTFYPINPIAVTNYLWDFGDGNSSDEMNPTHTFADSGRYVVRLYVDNKCSEDSTDLEIFVRPQNTSIEETGWAQFVNIYPNPTQDVLNIQTVENEKFDQIVVYNMIGQTILTQRFLSTNQYSLSLKDYAKGNYFIMIQNGDGQKAIKSFILQ